MKKEPISRENRKDYLKYKIRTALPVSILDISFFAIFLFVVLSLVRREASVLGYVVSWLITAVIRFAVSRPFRTLLFRNIFVIDGRIFKKHTFRYNKGSSERESGPIPMGRAISDNGGITTPWIYLPRKYFGQKDIRVVIIMHKDKAFDFYVV